MSGSCKGQCPCLPGRTPLHAAACADTSGTAVLPIPQPSQQCKRSCHSLALSCSWPETQKGKLGTRTGGDGASATHHPLAAALREYPMSLPIDPKVFQHQDLSTVLGAAFEHLFPSWPESPIRVTLHCSKGGGCSPPGRSPSGQALGDT